VGGRLSLRLRVIPRYGSQERIGTCLRTCRRRHIEPAHSPDIDQGRVEREPALRAIHFQATSRASYAERRTQEEPGPLLMPAPGTHCAFEHIPDPYLIAPL